ncbi:MAG: hypothetical protein ACO3UU_15855, partial [Minisyncoccia bacterium]
MSIFNSNAVSNVNIGFAANDGTGDPLRTAFEKINNNFVDVYVFLGNGTHLGNVTRVNILGGNLTGVANVSTANTIFTGNLSTPTIFHNSGTIDILNNLNVVGDLDIDGGALTFSTSQANIGGSATVVRLGTSATTVNIGSLSGTTTIRNDLAVVGALNLQGNVNTGNISATRGIFTYIDADHQTGTVRSAVVVEKSPYVNVNILGNVTGSGNVFLNNISGNVINVTVTLENSGVSASTYGNSRIIPRLVIDAKGRVTSAANI